MRKGAEKKTKATAQKKTEKRQSIQADFSLQ
jgi:hypothetical protein